METLVTKLKATVNNPNLPLLEVMQQFTLDAITASGNSVMTDNQKWALNHFFYQIGAIDGNGIASKLDVLYLPLICNKNVNKAYVDYIGDYTIDSSNYMDTPVFSGNGIISSDGTAKTVKTKLYYPTTCLAYTAIVGTAPKGSNSLTSILNEAPTPFTIHGISSTGTTLRVVNGEIECQYSGKSIGTTVSLITRKGTSNYSSKIINNGELYDDYVVVAPASPVSAPDEHGYIIRLRNLPLKVFAFGAALTSEEENIAVNAINELQLAFPD